MDLVNRGEQIFFAGHPRIDGRFAIDGEIFDSGTAQSRKINLYVPERIKRILLTDFSGRYPCFYGLDKLAVDDIAANDAGEDNEQYV